MVCGWQSSATKNAPPPLIACAIAIASAAAVDSSSSEAFEISIAVRSQTMVWKFNRASNTSLRDLRLIRV